MAFSIVSEAALSTASCAFFTASDALSAASEALSVSCAGYSEVFRAALSANEAEQAMKTAI